MRLKAYLNISIIGFAFSCAQSDFSGSAYKAKNKNNETKTPGTDNIDPETGELQSGSGSFTKVERQEKCWFAVSGGWIGANTKSVPPQFTDWGSIFPKTKSGKAISHGERFDDVGGIFLESRNEPYTSEIPYSPRTAGKNCVMNSSPAATGKELDQAILCTFDSIAIAPHMHAIIKSTTNGAILYEGNGPFIGVSDNHPEYGGPYFSLLKTSNMLIDWMQQYIKGISSIQVIKGLQSATYVQVSAIKGSPCDSDSN